MTDTVLTASDRAELDAYRARDARNARRRELRVANRGNRALGAVKRFSSYFPDYVQTGDVSLRELADLAELYDRQLDSAVIRLVEIDGWSWAMVGEALGVTRQAAQKRFGHLVKSTRRRGAQPADLR